MINAHPPISPCRQTDVHACKEAEGDRTKGERRQAAELDRMGQKEAYGGRRKHNDTEGGRRTQREAEGGRRRQLDVEGDRRRQKEAEGGRRRQTEADVGRGWLGTLGDSRRR